jgi:putative endopeptidase
LIEEYSQFTTRDGLLLDGKSALAENMADLVPGGAYAPKRYRVNGVLMNIPEFYEAFGVKPGDPMYRAESARVQIW